VGLILLQKLSRKVSQTKLSPTTQDAKRNGTAVFRSALFWHAFNIKLRQAKIGKVAAGMRVRMRMRMTNG